MKIVFVSGSHRTNSQSEKIARFMAAQLPQQDAEADVISLAGNPLPLWDGGATKPESPTGKIWPHMAQHLRAADGFVIVAPEWHGMVPAALKNFLLHTTLADVGHKPALLVGVSAARGGNYVISELRMGSTKNNRLLYIPEQIVVQNCGNVLNGPQSSGSDDDYVRGRIGFALRQLLAYARILGPLRQQGVTEDPAYPNGM